MTEQRLGISYDLEPPFLPMRRYTDAPQPAKGKLPSVHVPRPRTKSWNQLSESEDYGALAHAAKSQSKGLLKHGNDLSLLQVANEGEDPRKRRDSVPESKKRRLLGELRGVFQKHTRTQETETARKSKSTTRVRAVSPILCSPQNISFQLGSRFDTGRKSVVSSRRKPQLARFQRQATLGKRSESEEKYQFRQLPVNVLKGPSACKLYVVDLLLVKRYKEEQQHILSAIRELSGLREPHSILRKQIQAYAPWTAEENTEKEVRFA